MVCLFGPTAVGKTNLLLELNQILSKQIEVINADSRQVYKCLDIGTAKPDDALLAQVPHHFISCREPSEQFNVGDFIRVSDPLAREIWARNHIPIMAGGTAFYFKHFIYGLPAVPPSDPKARESLEKQLKEKGLEAMYRKLYRQDPISAQRINKNDSYRIIRALEVSLASNQPLSSFAISREQRALFRFLIIGLKRERKKLNSRIDRRVEQMFQSGLMAEVKSLLEKGLNESDPGMRGIGYKEFFTMREAGCLTWPMIKEMIQRHSRQYAKRQVTFFNKIKGVQWFHPDEKEKIKARIEEFLKQSEAP